MNKQQFLSQMSKLGITLTSLQLNQFEQYYQLLIEWNKKINLTRIIERDLVYLKHFYDSATIIKVIDLNKEKTFCDVGSGAGFPGIVIKILYPHLEVTLIDSLLKRIKFLEVVIKKLKLEKIISLHIRAEDYAKKRKEGFDVVTARAVASINLLLEYCFPLVKKGKWFVAMKGDLTKEEEKLGLALKKIKGELQPIHQFYLPFENSIRTLVLIKKHERTFKK